MSFTFADNKLGGRIQTACDAIAAGKLRTAAGIFNEVASELNVEAESTDGLMSEETAPQPAKPIAPAKQPDSMDLQSCARGAHSFGGPDPISGWSTCSVCGQVLVTPPR